MRERLRRVSVSLVLAMLFAFLGAFWWMAYHDPRGMSFDPPQRPYTKPVPGVPTLDDDFPVRPLTR